MASWNSVFHPCRVPQLYSLEIKGVYYEVQKHRIQGNQKARRSRRSLLKIMHKGKSPLDKELDKPKIPGNLTRGISGKQLPPTTSLEAQSPCSPEKQLIQKSSFWGWQSHDFLTPYSQRQQLLSSCSWCSFVHPQEAAAQVWEAPPLRTIQVWCRWWLESSFLSKPLPV